MERAARGADSRGICGGRAASAPVLCERHGSSAVETRESFKLKVDNKCTCAFQFPLREVKARGRRRSAALLTTEMPLVWRRRLPLRSAEFHKLESFADLVAKLGGRKSGASRQTLGSITFTSSPGVARAESFAVPLRSRPGLAWI